MYELMRELKKTTEIFPFLPKYMGVGTGARVRLINSKGDGMEAEIIRTMYYKTHEDLAKREAVYNLCPPCGEDRDKMLTYVKSRITPKEVKEYGIISYSFRILDNVAAPPK